MKSMKFSLRGWWWGMTADHQVRRSHESRSVNRSTPLPAFRSNFFYLVFLDFNTLPSSINTSSTRTICRFSHILIPPTCVPPASSRFISTSHFLFLPTTFCSSLPCLPAPMFCPGSCVLLFFSLPPVGLCVCCNELYLIANRDPQP